MQEYTKVLFWRLDGKDVKTHLPTWEYFANFFSTELYSPTAFAYSKAIYYLRLFFVTFYLKLLPMQLKFGKSISFSITFSDAHGEINWRSSKVYGERKILNSCFKVKEYLPTQGLSGHRLLLKKLLFIYFFNLLCIL